MKQNTKFVSYFCLSVLISVLLYYNTSRNNVCTNYYDYLFIRSSENCYHEIGLYAEVPQIILRLNYTLQTFYSVTEDGYILKTFRVLPRTREPKGIVLLEHSFIANAEIWIDKGENSLGLYLLRRGYEVWLGNLRGSKYSNAHVTYTMSDLEYWDWSFHEQGVYDLKAQLDLIAATTRRNDTVFVGYSMAGSSAIAYASMLPDHAARSLKAIVNLAGLAHIRNVGGLTPYIGYAVLNSGIMKLMDYLKIGFLPYGTSLRAIKSIFCTSHPFKALCLLAHEPIIGFSKTEFDATNAPIVLDKFPDGASTKIILHYAQIHARGGKMRMYDYGAEKNRILYNATVAPLYPLHRIKVPIVSFTGTEDFFTHREDVDEFYDDLSAEAKIYGRFQVKGYNHFDIMFAKNRADDVYRPLAQVLKKIFNT